MILSTVEQHRRRARRQLAAALALSLTFIGVAFAFSLARPGAPVDSALGLEMPSGTRVIREEHAASPRAAFGAMYLSSTLPVDTAVARFGALPGVLTHGERRFLLPDGRQVVVAPAREIPATQLGPIEPVYEGVPLGTRSWIIVSRGAPPDSTGVVSVPPLGES